jgi:hypothetical protein
VVCPPACGTSVYKRYVACGGHHGAANAPSIGELCAYPLPYGGIRTQIALKDFGGLVLWLGEDYRTRRAGLCRWCLRVCCKTINTIFDKPYVHFVGRSTELLCCAGRTKHTMLSHESIVRTYDVVR